MAEDQNNVSEETQTEEVISPQQEVAQPPEETHKTESSDKEMNFRKLRETKEQLEKENRELKNWVQKASLPIPEPLAEDELGIEDDDIVEGKVVKRLYNELKELKKFKTSYEEEKIASIPQRLKTKFDDFESVVTQENIEKLKNTEPELYASITSGQDLYAKEIGRAHV